MNELIEHIRAAVAQGATAEQKALGAQACRTILTAIEAEPGKPIAMPGVSAPNPLSRLSVDQVLDLVIARLGSVAAARESPASPPPPAPSGLRIPVIPPVVRHPTSQSSVPNRRKP